VISGLIFIPIFLTEFPGTLPYEFRGSILVFVFLLGLSQTRVFLRLSTLASIGWYCMYHGSWQSSLFAVGIILAELRHIRNESTSCLEDIFKNSNHVTYARYITSECEQRLIFSFSSNPIFLQVSCNKKSVKKQTGSHRLTIISHRILLVLNLRSWSLPGQLSHKGLISKPRL
jgi:hypothetical protein